MSSAAKFESPELEESSTSEELMQFSSSAKELERQRLQQEVEAFLASGGLIRQIPANLRADPPKKPESNYGGQPI